MPQINLDFGDVQSFEALPKANYSGVIEKVELKPSNSSEFPYLGWTINVTQAEYVNRKLFLNTSLSPKALFRLKDLFEKFGCYQEKMTLDYDESGILLQPSFVGVPVIAVVSQETYNGRLQNRVDDLLPVSKEGVPGGQPATAGGRVLK